MNSAHAKHFPQPADPQEYRPTSNTVNLRLQQHFLSHQEIADLLNVFEGGVRDHATRLS